MFQIDSCLVKMIVGFSLIISTMVESSMPELSEKDLVVEALRVNPDIQIQKIDYKKQSLSLYQTRSRWYPSLDLFANPSFSFLDPQSVTIDASAQLNQEIPGGGLLSLSYNHAMYNPLDTNYWQTSDEMYLTVYQPLLRNAWNHSENRYAITIKRLDSTQSSIALEKQIYQSVTTTRNLYWDAFKSYHEHTILKKQREYAQKLLEVERQKYATGITASIDTLDALLEYMKLDDLVRNSILQNKITLRKLANELNRQPSDITLSFEDDIAFEDLPSPANLMQKIQKFDPNGRVFEIMTEKLELLYEQSRFDLLPDVSLRGSVGKTITRYAESGKIQSSNHTDGVIGLIVSYSLWPTSKKINRDIAQLEWERTKIEQSDYKGDLILKLEEMVLAWDNEKEAIEQYETLVSIARLKRDAIRIRFEQGAIDRLSLVKSEDDYRDATLQLLKRKLQLKKIEIVLDEMMGNSLIKFGVSIP